MKRVVFFILLYVMFTNVIYAQTDMGRLNRGVEAAVDKALREHNAKQKKAKEEVERKEREKAQRHEEQRRRHEENYKRQMENLNQVSASDFMNSHQQQGGNFSTEVGKFRENQQSQTVVATPNNKKVKANQAKGNASGNSGRVGTPTYSGLNYSGDRYNFKRAGFDNAQQRPQVRVPANQIRGQYKPNRKMNQGVVNLQRTDVVPKAKVQRTLPQIIAQAPQQQRDAQGLRLGQMSQRQQTFVLPQNKVRVNENGKLIIDTSKGPVYVTLQQNNSSTDLAPVDTRRIDYATKVNNITVYNVPVEILRPQNVKANPTLRNEAPYLSDEDNKIPSSVTSNQTIKKSGSGRSQADQYKLMRQDAANGFKSFNNRQKWEQIYGVANAGTVTVKRIVIKKR